MGFSDYLETSLLNGTIRNIAYVPVATVYVALFTTDPLDDGSGTEVAGGAYARQACAFGAPALGVCLNSALITFPTATAPWGTVTHSAIFDALAGGNLLYHAPLTTARYVNTGDTEHFNIGSISVTLD